MDDSNIPSLLSLPYIEADLFSGDGKWSSLYQSTRKWILSKNNPYFFSGVDKNT